MGADLLVYSNILYATICYALSPATKLSKPPIYDSPFVIVRDVRFIAAYIPRVSLACATPRIL